jgi:cytochrome c-type biogenesis protein CcmH
MLVRSHLRLGQIELAQSAYDRARAAYPDAAVRTELDVLAADNGLVAN